MTYHVTKHVCPSCGRFRYRNDETGRLMCVCSSREFKNVSEIPVALDGQEAIKEAPNAPAEKS